MAGVPVFILRAPVAGQADRMVTLDFGRGAPRPQVALTTCDATLCIGLLSATSDIRRRIGTGGAVEVTLVDRAGAPVALRTTLDGLATAIASIK